MNKHFFLGSLVLLGLLFSFNVLALEKQVMNIDDCVNITIELLNTTQVVSPGEYSFKDCTYTDKWICQCSGNYDLILITEINTINTYDFRINYTTEYYTQSTRRGGGSNYVYLNSSNISINTTPINTTPINNVSVPISVPIKEAVKPICPPEKTCQTCPECPNCDNPTCNETPTPKSWRTTAIITIITSLLLTIYIMYKKGVFTWS